MSERYYNPALRPVGLQTLNHLLGSRCPVFQDIVMSFGEHAAWTSLEKKLVTEVQAARARGDNKRALRLELQLLDVEMMLKRLPKPRKRRAKPQ